MTILESDTKRQIDLCIELYEKFYLKFINSGQSETEAQRKAIAKSFEEAVSTYGIANSTHLWRAIQSAHVKRKSGALIDSETIKLVSSANQSWNKSSGHAFEQGFCQKINSELATTKIRFLLQREVSESILSHKAANKERDLQLIKGWLDSSSFDVYSVIYNDKMDKFTIFGCVQCKTSIRDRVTRDREPSLQAMNLYFWSIAVVIDGGFLNLPKFTAMVNGGTGDYNKNGWHGMYAFSECAPNDRIYALTDALEPLSSHAQNAANSWIKDRQWIDVDWRYDT